MNQKHQLFICKEFHLGLPDGVATRVYGGRGGSLMWRVNTEKGSYAIKQLAPVIDLKSERIVTKYELSEMIAYRFIQFGIPAVSALEKSGKHLITIENTGYLVYPWIEAYTLGRYEISETHALKIAKIIASLHSINMNVPEIEPPRFDIHTNDSIVEAIDMTVSFKCPFAKTLKEKQSLILSVNDSYQSAIPLLKEDTVVTHGDLDQLNILWDKADQPILIDWESARTLNPTREIVRASLGWSGIGTEDFSLLIYDNILRTYIKSGGMLNISHVNAALYAMFGSLLNWMLYNIETACTSDVPSARNTGIEEINWALMNIVRLNILIPGLLKVSIKK
jgi:thiamine kinase-like enzyme